MHLINHARPADERSFSFQLHPGQVLLPPDLQQTAASWQRCLHRPCRPREKPAVGGKDGRDLVAELLPKLQRFVMPGSVQASHEQCTTPG